MQKYFEAHKLWFSMNILVYYTCFWCIFQYFPFMENLSDHFFVIIFCVGARLSTLLLSSDWSDPYFFRRKMEKTRSVKEEMEGELFISCQSRHISFVSYLIWVKYFSLICTLTWRVNNFVSRQGKGINRRNESAKGNIFNITLIISWLYWLRLVGYSKEQHFLL